jgi:hypothetical protein
VIGNPGERGIPPVLDPADHGPDLLEVLPGLEPPWPSQLVGVRRFTEQLLQQIRRWNPVHAFEPPADLAPHVQQHATVFVAKQSELDRRC